jgi:hypothetical protein
MIYITFVATALGRAYIWYIFGHRSTPTSNNYRTMKHYLVAILALGIISFSSCKKDELIQRPVTPQEVHRVSKIKIKNYINRTYIDILGRNPTNEEMDSIVVDMEENDLSAESRLRFIKKIQTDTTFRFGDSTYAKVYYQRVYDMVKAKMIEGTNDDEFYKVIGNASFSIRIARLEGDSVRVFSALERIDRAQKVLDSKQQYRYGEITLSEMFSRMANNHVYDLININTFNFVNATFDDYFYRFPSGPEFDIGFDIIQNNAIGYLFGGYASNKAEYTKLLTESDEFYLGLINWTYLSLLSRSPSAQESSNIFSKLKVNGNFQEVQQIIASSDEYANF